MAFAFASRRAFGRTTLNTVRRLSQDTNYIDPVGKPIKYTTNLGFIEPSTERIPCYRVLDLQGNVLPGATPIQLPSKDLLHMYRTMNTVRIMDSVLYDAQRQGRISFYMTCTGEEGAVVGSAQALKMSDMVFSQYREHALLMHRGFSVQQFANQCASNVEDPSLGRQMPMHYGDMTRSFQFVSSPLATQIPHAVGHAYGLKREQEHTPVADRDVSVVFFGDGAASEGDFHAAMNFAATLQVPCMFMCRNNGFAISTPVHDQFRGDGIVVRAPGYGMHGIRVDGNDVLAVVEAVSAARKYCSENHQPILVEMMSYRVGHHSTSDDSTRYRSSEEIQDFRQLNCPIQRLRGFLESQQLWDQTKQEEFEETTRQQVLEALDAAEAVPKAPLRTLLDDVYDTRPPHLQKQAEELKHHVAKHKAEYQQQLAGKHMVMDIDL